MPMKRMRTRFRGIATVGRCSLRLGPALVAAILLTAPGALPAQNSVPDITGYWDSLLTEEYRIRLYGPEPGEIEGLPLNEKGREAALNFDPDEYYKPENQCRKHGGAYVMRGPFAKHFSYADDGTLIIRVELEAQTRYIYMDGRPPPSDEHTGLGHSVGAWHDGILTVTTTQMTPYYHRRNGVPYSENAVMTEHFIPHDGEYLTLITKVDDPEYLSEPLVRSVSFKKLPDSYAGQFHFDYDCEVVEWEGGAPGAAAQ
jgi:peptidoglycan hydrolase-like protein with peptidoglycan-binding domain